MAALVSSNNRALPNIASLQVFSLDKGEFARKSGQGSKQIFAAVCVMAQAQPLCYFKEP
jgi:hypothetical protein